MKISYDGLNEKVVTFLAEGDIKVGDLVKLSDNDTVATCTEGDVFIGAAVAVSGGLCSVQVGGFYETVTKNWMDPGYVSLAIDEKGHIVRSPDYGHTCLIVNYDSVTGKATLMF